MTNDVNVTTKAKPSHIVVALLTLGGRGSVVPMIGWAQFDPTVHEPTSNVGQYALDWGGQKERHVSSSAVAELMVSSALVRKQFLMKPTLFPAIVAELRKTIEENKVTHLWMYRHDMYALEAVANELEVQLPFNGLQFYDPPTAFGVLAETTGRGKPERDDAGMEPQGSVIGDCAWTIRAVRHFLAPSQVEIGVGVGA